MLSRRTHLKRTAFKARSHSQKPEENREQTLMQRAQAAMNSVVPRVAMMGGSCTGASVHKEPPPLRSEKYRRAVASLPCAHCGIAGYSQHAHENEGKGKGQKLDDRRAMPLCCARPGIEGCHAAYDQYRLVPGGRAAHIELGRAMAAQTRNTLNTSGLWPAGIPQYPEEDA